MYHLYPLISFLYHHVLVYFDGEDPIELLYPPVIQRGNRKSTFEMGVSKGKLPINSVFSSKPCLITGGG